jgi:CheY-like chemotaxis protein/Tfp pilus assembly protein PilZ
MGKRILVVETGMPVVPFEQSLLLRKDHEVFRASSAAEALEKVEQIMPHLIVLDDHTPDMKISSLIRQIRSMPAGRNASVLLLAGPEGEDAPEGVNLVLRKPVVGQEFNDACRRLLSVEARKEARLLVYVNVQGFSQDNLFLCNSLNLSASGILILTARKMKMGETVQLQITLPREREKIRVSGMVMRDAQEVDSRLNAYGVAFQNLSAEEGDRLRNYVEEERQRNHPRQHQG